MSHRQTIHILNGQEMYNHFKITRFMDDQVLLPFNEAMCDGETCSDIFSESFIQLRANVHGVTTEQYEKITIEPLHPLLNGGFSKAVMWFDADMFCQMNLLTILAWLDQVNYAGEAHLHLVGDRFELIEKFRLEIAGYKKLYDEVMIDKRLAQHVEPAPLRNGVALYLNYLEPQSDLMCYIVQQQDVPKQTLIPLLLKNFKHYGLGDIQYAKLIDHVRGARETKRNTQRDTKRNT